MSNLGDFEVLQILKPEHMKLLGIWYLKGNFPLEIQRQEADWEAWAWRGFVRRYNDLGLGYEFANSGDDGDEPSFGIHLVGVFWVSEYRGNGLSDTFLRLIIRDSEEGLYIATVQIFGEGQKLLDNPKRK